MIHKTYKHLLITMLVLVSVAQVSAQSIPIDSLYLGQIPPGNTPKIFTIPLQTGLRPVERIAITNDGKEIYFGLLNTYPPTIQRTRCMKYLDNRWQGPFDVFEGHAAPRLAPNDSAIYVQSNTNDFSRTYRAVRTDTGWGVLSVLTLKNQQTHYFQESGLHNYYVSSNLPSSPNQRDICRVFITATDTVFQGLGAPINTTSDENDFYIAPDERYMIFSRNASGAGDMYLTFKKQDGGWTNPKKFASPINKPGYSWEYGQFVSADGKYLFFTSGGTSMSSYYTYWVRIDNIIDSMKRANYVPYLNRQIPNQSARVNTQFSYTIPDSTFIDDDGNSTLRYSARLSNGSLLPDWLMFDSVAHTLSGTAPTAVALAIKITAVDSANVSVSSTFTLDCTVSGIGDLHGDHPQTMQLQQNYPNPCNPSTNICFQLSEPSFVLLRIFDITGRIIRELVHGIMPSGIHRYELDTSNFASGMYTYELLSGTYREQKKFIVLK